MLLLPLPPLSVCYPETANLVSATASLGLPPENQQKQIRVVASCEILMLDGMVVEIGEDGNLEITVPT